MQRTAGRFALVYLALTSAACMDQGHNDRALAEMDAARREAALDGRLQTLEREHAFVMQQVGALSASTNSSLMHTSVKEDERDKKLTDMSAQIGGITQMISAWREEERPQPLDAEARRIAEQGSAEDRAAAIRKVQALIDAGRIKLSMHGGRIQLTQVRPIDATNPYEPPKTKPTPPPATPIAPPPKRPIDRLGF
jgi:hypothetical protein